MSLNYNITVNIFEEDGVTGIQNTKVHSYFEKVNINSSESQWDNKIRLTNGIGQTSFNLGDGSFLTSEGQLYDDDIILITAWVSNNNDITINDKSSGEKDTLTRCINFFHIIDTSKSIHTENFVCPVLQNPVCDIFFPTSTLTGHEFTITNNSHINEGPFSFYDGNVYREDLYQNTELFGETLFSGRDIESTKYNLVETDVTVQGIEDFTYSWIDAGIYNTIVEVTDKLGIKCYKEIEYKIKYNKPNIDFSYSFSKGLNIDPHIGVGNDDILTCINLSSTNFGDTFEQINTSFDWNITDTTQNLADNTTFYIDKDINFQAQKTFLSSGHKDIKLEFKWFDGFENQTETLINNVFLDTYKIKPNFVIITDKLYKINDICVPLGDNDLVTIDNQFEDINGYNSTDFWNNIEYKITKKIISPQGEITADNETFLIENETDIASFYVRYNHIENSPFIIKQTINYFDGYKDIETEIEKDFITKTYTLAHVLDWETSNYGRHAVVTTNEDEISIIEESFVLPQDDREMVTKVTYRVNKERYSNDDSTSFYDDREAFEYNTIDNNVDVRFFIGKEGANQLSSTIEYYDGFEKQVSIIEDAIYSEVLTPLADFKWESRNGDNSYIQGRDDSVTFSQFSRLKDYYDDIKSVNSVKNLKISWFLENNITEGSFININSIGGPKYEDNETRTDTFLDVDLFYKPVINYFSELVDQEVIMRFYYHNGFRNTYVNVIRFIDTVPYNPIIPNALYNDNIKERHEIVSFQDNSINADRIIDIDWSLTDRYEENSMTEDKQGQDNYQEWLNILPNIIIETTINSNEDHILNQDKIRWDNGFREIIYENNYLIKTINSSIIENFMWENKYITGPDIIFTNTSESLDKAKQISYELYIRDSLNDGTPNNQEFLDINYLDKLEYKYSSCSNNPFEEPNYNKEVIMTIWYDDGWNERFKEISKLINVQPNSLDINNFIIEYIRHPEDINTDNTIIGNNPIEFYNDSYTSRIKNSKEDLTFINKITYEIES